MTAILLLYLEEEWLPRYTKLLPQLFILLGDGSFIIKTAISYLVHLRCQPLSQLINLDNVIIE